jgi:hypothetical protein
MKKKNNNKHSRNASYIKTENFQSLLDSNRIFGTFMINKREIKKPNMKFNVLMGRKDK